MRLGLSAGSGVGTAARAGRAGRAVLDRRAGGSNLASSTHPPPPDRYIQTRLGDLKKMSAKQLKTTAISKEEKMWKMATDEWGLLPQNEKNEHVLFQHPQIGDHLIAISVQDTASSSLFATGDKNFNDVVVSDMAVDSGEGTLMTPRKVAAKKVKMEAMQDEDLKRVRACDIESVPATAEAAQEASRIIRKEAARTSASNPNKTDRAVFLIVNRPLQV